MKIKVSQPHGWPALRIKELLGKSLIQDINEDEPIDEHMVEKDQA